MFNWDTEKSSKKLSIDEDCLSVKVKDGSGFKTSMGDQVRLMWVHFNRLSNKEADTISKCS